MARVTPLLASQPVVDKDGTMAQQFLLWALRTTEALRITGTGSPEGNLAAPIHSTYYDINGTTGTIIYIKMLTSIAGDTKQGWVLA